MISPLTMNKKKLAEYFDNCPVAFVGRSSFEARSIRAYDELSECNIIYRHFFLSLGEAKLAGKIREPLSLTDDDESVLDTTNPMQTRDAILNQFKIIAKLQEIDSLVIDVTSFRREELLILQKSMSVLPDQIRSKASFIYTAATNMGTWLSKNVRQIRPVIGYPGEIFSRKPSHLIILVGIEHHRARAIIEAYEPSQISLGMVSQADSTSTELYERNLELRNYIRSSSNNITNEFYFSATDPRSVMSELEKIVHKQDEFNIIIAPLNTKMSTLACGEFALQNPFIQLCYAEVGLYNVVDYSVSGCDVMLFSYKDLGRIE